MKKLEDVLKELESELKDATDNDGRDVRSLDKDEQEAEEEADLEEEELEKLEELKKLKEMLVKLKNSISNFKGVSSELKNLLSHIISIESMPAVKKALAEKDINKNLVNKIENLNQMTGNVFNYSPEMIFKNEDGGKKKEKKNQQTNINSNYRGPVMGED